MNRWKIVAVAVATLVLAVPMAVSAATSMFEDVPDNSIYVNDINWLATAGVTKGCNPPTNTKFCPGNNVTREQMAAFMHRLAANQVVDAGTVQGLTAAELKGQQGDVGPIGPQGEKGATGDTGPQGPAGIAGYYVVEEAYEAPDTIPEPPKPYPNDGSASESLILPGGQPLASCVSGDVAMDGVAITTYTQVDTDTGDVYESVGHTALAFYPLAGSAAPSGYGYVKDVTLTHEYKQGFAADRIPNIETTQSLVARVTCADMTP